jgi:hypothetical protein
MPKMLDAGIADGHASRELMSGFVPLKGLSPISDVFPPQAYAYPGWAHVYNKEIMKFCRREAFSAFWSGISKSELEARLETYAQLFAALAGQPPPHHRCPFRLPVRQNLPQAMNLVKMSGSPNAGIPSWGLFRVFVQNRGLHKNGFGILACAKPSGGIEIDPVAEQRDRPYACSWVDALLPDPADTRGGTRFERNSAWSGCM